MLFTLTCLIDSTQVHRAFQIRLDTMVKRPCSERLNVKRQNWTEEEDVKNKTGMRRGGKSCGFKWTNCSRGDDNFTPEEEDLIIRLHAAIGSRWSIIAQQLPGRTDGDVKNCWNTKLRKKLSEIGIDPVTHKPFSQILVDYANIGGYAEAERARTDCLNRDLKNSFIVNSNQFSIPQEQGFSNFNTNFLRPKLTNPTQENSAMRFTWSDFLLEDPFSAADAQKTEIEIIQRDTKQEEKAVQEMNSSFTNNGFQASSSDCSFVEAMLDRQKDMLLEFSGLLDDSFFS